MGTSGFKLAVDLKQLEVLKKDFKFRSPKAFAGVVRGLLNDQAFAVREVARNAVLPNKFNIRNNFVRSSILVEKSPKSIRNVNVMIAQVGAAKKWKQNSGKPFTGLRLQEFGGIAKDPRILSLTSRGGTFSKLMGRPYQKLGRAKEKAVDYPGSNSGRVINMLRKLQFDSSEYFKGPFIIRGHNKIRDGVYVFGKERMRETARGRMSRTNTGKRSKNKYRTIRKIVMIKDLSFKSVRVKPTYWLKTSMDKAINPKTTVRFFLKNAQREFDRASLIK